MKRKKITGGGSKEVDALYQSTYDYVIANGGSLSVIGGVQISEDVLKPGLFTIGVKCTGIKPDIAKLLTAVMLSSEMGNW